MSSQDSLKNLLSGNVLDEKHLRRLGKLRIIYPRRVLCLIGALIKALGYAVIPVEC
jgi:hypothetical protein